MACNHCRGVGTAALYLLIIAVHVNLSAAGTAAVATSEVGAVEWPTDSMEPPDGICPGLGEYDCMIFCQVSIQYAD